MLIESQNIEYKSVWKDEYLKWICGFANANGGTLFVGVDDTGKVKHLDNAGKTRRDRYLISVIKIKKS